MKRIAVIISVPTIALLRIREVAEFRSDLLAYRSGPTYARYEVYQALAERGSPQDLELLVDSFVDPDDDVRISVAYAYLSIAKKL